MYIDWILGVQRRWASECAIQLEKRAIEIFYSAFAILSSRKFKSENKKAAEKRTLMANISPLEIVTN